MEILYLKQFSTFGVMCKIGFFVFFFRKQLAAKIFFFDKKKLPMALPRLTRMLCVNFSSIALVAAMISVVQQTNRQKKLFFHITPIVLSRLSSNSHTISVLVRGVSWETTCFEKFIIFADNRLFAKKKTDQRSRFFHISPKVLN